MVNITIINTLIAAKKGFSVHGNYHWQGKLTGFCPFIDVCDAGDIDVEAVVIFLSWTSALPGDESMFNSWVCDGCCCCCCDEDDCCCCDCCWGAAAVVVALGELIGDCPVAWDDPNASDNLAFTASRWSRRPANERMLSSSRWFSTFSWFKHDSNEATENWYEFW